MDLSIVIVTHNSEKYILNCLDSITKATRTVKHEIFVVDNASKDQTVQRISSSTDSLTLLLNPENQGFARAINRGLTESSGDFLLLMNPDIVIQSESLQPMINFMRSYPKVGVCGCKLLNEDGSLQYSMGPFPTLLSTVWRRVFPRQTRRYHVWGYDEESPCDWITGAFMMIRKEVSRLVGLLDENYFLYYEDVDYCLRAKKLGWSTYYFPGVSAYHLHPHAQSQSTQFTEETIRNSRMFFFKKHRSLLAYYILLFLTRCLEERITFLTKRTGTTS
ncbi:MAG: glycosyltransferase family 2 protein [Desulfobacterales bacterium]|nr:glycosyltransferase family 2 protein [Desulfobacterales bacterium]